MDRSLAKKSNVGIRSLSAPTIQVRKNRTSNLRNIFSVHNDDLSYLARPPMGETNPSVAGQNKSTAKMNQKQIGLWFRDRCYVVDKLERYEDEVYERLVSIQKTKWQIQRSRDNSPETPSRQRGSLPRIDSRITGMIASLAAEHKKEEIKEGNEEIKDANPASNEGKSEDTGDKEKKGENPTGKSEDTGDKEKRGDNPTDNTTDKNTSINVSSKVVPVRPMTQHNSSTDLIQPEMAPRAATSGEAMLDSARKAQGDVISFPQPQTGAEFMPSKSASKLNRMTQSENNLNSVYAHKTSPKKSTESISKAREIEQKILNEPFVYWKKDATGKLIKADIPYKRREFPLPVERNDDQRRKILLASERKSKRDHMKKYRSLCSSLETLEKFNPLEEAMLLRKMEEEAAQAEFDAQEKWKKLGMLRHWVKAVQVREQKELEGLDPNSEEALRKCKYLRIQEKKPSITLTPQQEKEIKKSNWISNLQKRISKATGKPVPTSQSPVPSAKPIPIRGKNIPTGRKLIPTS